MVRVAGTNGWRVLAAAFMIAISTSVSADPVEDFYRGKSLRMLPNSRHSTQGTDIGDSMTAWYDAVIHDRPIPDYSWTVNRDGALMVRTETKPTEVRL